MSNKILKAKSINRIQNVGARGYFWGGVLNQGLPVLVRGTGQDELVMDPHCIWISKRGGPVRDHTMLDFIHEVASGSHDLLKINNEIMLGD